MEGELANGDAAEAHVQHSVNHVHDQEADVPPLRLRLLCPHALVPALIGKRGDNVKRIRRESGAAVSVADPAMGCDERVVHITGERVDDEAGSSAADALVSVFSDLCSLQQQRRGEAPAAAPSPAPSSAVSSAGEGGGAAAAGPPPRPVEARMLVDSSLVGFLVGRGGVTIKDTMARSGAGVRVLPKAELPACACVTDEVVRVAGSPASVHAALRLLAGQVKAHTLRHGQPRRGGGGGGPAAPPPLLVGQAPAELAYMHPSMAAAAAFYPPGAGSAGLPPPGGFAGAAVEACFRLLAPAARTGNIIGKGGEHVRRIRAETGARIKVFDPAPGSEERVVALTSSEDALSPYCAAQDALVRCVLALVGDEPAAAAQRVRLLTAQASVGCVLGKRGATVSQLRAETGASVKVLPADPLPAAFGGGGGGDDASEAELGSLSSGSGGASGGGGEEVIQVEGSVHQVVAALRGVATLLRGWQVRRLLTLQQHAFNGGGGGGPMGGPPPPLAAPMPASPTGGAVMSPTSPGIMGVHLPSSLSSPSQPPFMLVNGGMHSPPPAAHALLPPGALMVPTMGPPPPRGMTYVYHLSNAQVGAVLGKGGAHIAQIRGMSGARVQLQGEGEGGGRVLMVAGHPEQVHAAHVMANAFLSMGRCEPAYPEPIHGG